MLCPIKPLDKAANADGQRRRLDPAGQDLSPLPPTGMAPLLRELLAEYAATGMPPAYLYRELGDIFTVPRATKRPLRGPGPYNRWGGFKSLRERWLAHLESTRHRAVLLIDEAQEMSPAALCELRLMASACFDSQPLLCIVLVGDARLIEKLRREELIPLNSRIRTRLATEHASRDELLAGLSHLLAGAGNVSLMTPGLRQTLCDHAVSNYRILTTMAAELLAAAAQRELPQLDEKLYLDVFAQPEDPAHRRTAVRR